METNKETGTWKRVKKSINRFFKELKAESVASNPRKPVDCCNPPVAPTTNNNSKNVKA